MRARAVADKQTNETTTGKITRAQIRVYATRFPTYTTDESEFGLTANTRKRGAATVTAAADGDQTVERRDAD